MYWYFPYLSLGITVRPEIGENHNSEILHRLGEEHRYKSRSENRQFFSTVEMVVTAHSIPSRIGWASISLTTVGAWRCL